MQDVGCLTLLVYVKQVAVAVVMLPCLHCQPSTLGCKKMLNMFCVVIQVGKVLADLVHEPAAAGTAGGGGRHGGDVISEEAQAATTGEW